MANDQVIVSIGDYHVTMSYEQASTVKLYAMTFPILEAVTPKASININEVYGKFVGGSEYSKNLREQLKQHRRKCKKLGRLVGEGRVDIEILSQALKDIVAQAEVHGFWNAEQKMAEAALDKVEALWKERAEAAKKRRGEE